jgi:hypothetical protein
MQAVGQVVDGIGTKVVRSRIESAFTTLGEPGRRPARSRGRPRSCGGVIVAV